MANTYPINSEICENLLSKKFNLTLEEIREKNSDELKQLTSKVNPECESYIEKTNDPSIERDNDKGNRVVIPEPPKTSVCKADTCSSQNNYDYVDILYVPSHPTTGKKTYYAVTDEAKEAIIKEQKTVKSSICASPEDTIKKINSLGIFSRFYTSSFEMFLSGDDKLRYRFFINAQKALLSGAAKAYENGGEDGFVYALAKKEGIDVNKQLEIYAQCAAGADTPIERSASGALKFEQTVSKLAKEDKYLQKARQSLKAHVNIFVKNKIEEYEDTALKKAKITDTNDGSKYVYDENKKYFTSKSEKDIEYLASAIFRRPPFNDTDDDVVFSDHEEALPRINTYYDSVEEYQKLLKDANGDVKKISANTQVFNYVNLLTRLNSFGYLVKEQCISLDMLEGTTSKHLGSSILKKYYSDWRDNKFFSNKGIPIDIDESDFIVDELADELSINISEISSIKKTEEAKKTKLTLSNSVINQWAYYPCLATNKVIDATLEQWVLDIKDILGAGIDVNVSNLNNSMKNTVSFPIPQRIKLLIWIKKLVLLRIENIKEKVRNNAKNKKGIRLLSEENTFNKTFKVIWDDEKYIAKEKKEKLISKPSGKADLQIIECVLISEGTAGWVRGPAWYLPKNSDGLKEAKGHIKDITTKFGFASKTANSETPLNFVEKDENGEIIIDENGKPSQNLKKALKKIVNDSTSNGKFLLDPFNIVNETKVLDNVFWMTSYHWEKGLGPEGTSSQYVVDASAQFLRFSSSLKSSLNVPYSSYNNMSINSDINVGGELNFSFHLLQGQITVSSWYPLNENNFDNNDKNKYEGYNLKIKYFVKDKDDSLTYKAGELFLRLSATVYGFAGASINIAGNIAFGHCTTSDGKVGVRGKALTLTDYNENQVYSKRVVDTQNLPKPFKNVSEKSSTGASVKADIFAGVEAGGIVSGEVYWRPPVITYDGQKIQDGMMKLGKICSQVAVSAGIGVTGEFHITFHMGKLYVMTKATVVCGPGVSGSVAIELDYLNVDRFIQCLLGVLHESGFVKIDALGSIGFDDRSEDFELLNIYLTVSMVFGLTLAEALLIPAKFINSIHLHGLQEDYAPMLATNILEKQNQKDNQLWVKQLPPETLSKLLCCLCNKGSFIDSVVDSSKYISDEKIKLQAVVQIISWMASGISSSSPKDTNLARRKFELTLIKMSGYMESAQNPIVKWQRFYRGWCMIIGFVNSMKYSLIKEEFDKLTPKFEYNINSLCGNFVKYTYLNNFGNSKNYELVYKIKSENDNQEIIDSRSIIEKEITTKTSGGKWIKTGWNHDFK